MTGKVNVIISESNNEVLLEKINTGFCYGNDRIISEQLYITIINKTLGLNFMKIEKDTFELIVSKWSNLKRKLGTLILDQKEIAGIGVAWGSEILYRAKMNPDIKACEQDLSKLSLALYETQEYIIKIYTEYFNNIISIDKNNQNNNFLVDFINGWYKNLYVIREMNIYKKGKELKSGGRVWWVKSI